MGENAQHISFSRQITLEMMQASLIQYILGAVTLACIAGLFLGELHTLD